MTNKLITRRSLVTGLTAGALLAHSHPSQAQALPRIVVSKDPTCGCCTGWVDHLRKAGFPAEVIETSEINRVKARLGVPDELASCHTAEIGGYVIDGHVPANAIKSLLVEKPTAKGLAVAGMPMGSPGMEIEGMAPDTYEVILFGPSGRKTFARYEGARLL
ncbi:DUF411 domain-containing protein [Microvirga sp. CF3062]|uniref:DUF411 domain-containing protein n=1 Tax=Microvirga sp. CF3062 TaxID=3110182 RepID=UPI002E76F9D0|nr:DUF411 domain-containing protein [Microvirga sp. CF3062]MEE1657596.1 DUF411 domain-containing protein [Microvirga sp. CF3062]